MSQIFTAVLLVVLGSLSRTILHIGPNFELVTASAVVAGFVIKDKRLALAVPLVTMMITDSIIGNTNIFIFTWSAYAATPLIGAIVSKIKNAGTVKKALAIEGAGLLSLLIFFLWTNLGVVLTTNMYEKSLSGLMASYINALPFLKPQLFSLVFGLPLVLMIVNFLQIRFSIKTERAEKSLLKLA